MVLVPDVFRNVSIFASVRFALRNVPDAPANLQPEKQKKPTRGNALGGVPSRRLTH